MSDDNLDPLVKAQIEGHERATGRIGYLFDCGYTRENPAIPDLSETEQEWVRRGYIVGLVDSGEFVSPLATLKDGLEKSAADYHAVSMSLQTPDLQTLAANIAANHQSIAKKIQAWLAAVEKSGLGDL